MLFLRSLLFYIGLIPAGLVFSTLALLLLPLPYQLRYQVLIRLGRFAIWWLEKTCQVSYQVQGLENIPFFLCRFGC